LVGRLELAPDDVQDTGRNRPDAKHINSDSHHRSTWRGERRS